MERAPGATGWVGAYSLASSPTNHCSVIKVTDVVQSELEVRGAIHVLRDKRPFSYNDGDQSELYVLDAIRRATDISSSSRELEQHIRDWSSRYHLSRERPLVYASLNL